MYTSGIVPHFLGGINMTRFIEERVNDLENEVKELKLIVHELGKPSTVIEEMSASSVEDKPKTANELRAEVIERAKRFVEKHTTPNTIDKEWNDRGAIKGFINQFGGICGIPYFTTNAERRAVTFVAKGIVSGDLLIKTVAQCHPNDVFNSHIGKAIALGRALGLDVSEFEQAVQPTEVVAGMVCEVEDFLGNPYIETAYDGWDSRHTVDALNHKTGSTLLKILNDTNAIYSEVNE